MPGGLAVSGWDGTQFIYPADYRDISGSAWVALPGGRLVPIVPSPHALPGHNAACLLSLRSGLDKPSAFFSLLIFYESQQILPQRKLPDQWEPGVCQK